MSARTARRSTPRAATLALMLALLLSPAALAATIEAEMAGHRLVLPVPPGYCTLDRSVEVQHELGEQIERVMSQRDVYLGAAIDCAELAALEDAPERGFTTYLIWMAEGDGNGEPVRYPDVGRGDFVEEAAAQGTNVDTGTASQEATDIWQQELDSDAIEIEALEIGMIGHDDSAYYATGLARIGGAGSDVRQAAMTLGTLLYGIHVQAYLYRPFEGPHSFEALEPEAAALAATLVAANPASDRPGNGFGIDLAATLRSALIGALVGTMVACVVWLFRRLRQAPGRHFD